MYTKEDLKNRLDRNNYNLDTETIRNYLREWHIDPVYEDENNVEYFDASALLKLKQGIKLKKTGSTDEEILLIINKNMVNSSKAVSINQTDILPQQNDSNDNLRKITVDITTQTLAVLADSIAQKISNDIASRVKENIINNSSEDIDKLRKDNEILAAQIEKLLDENKQLMEKINSLAQNNSKFKQIFGSFYMKQE